ncbi:hypothetical protein [Spirosoma endbachense]|nr:hypothetical protein [Spirosoma endbachense]
MDKNAFYKEQEWFTIPKRAIVVPKSPGKLIVICRRMDDFSEL